MSPKNVGRASIAEDRLQQPSSICSRLRGHGKTSYAMHCSYAVRNASASRPYTLKCDNHQMASAVVSYVLAGHRVAHRAAAGNL